MARVRVRARVQRGFWRSGLFWPRDWTERELDDEKALAVLVEPMLEASIVDAPTPGTPDTAEHQPRPDPPLVLTEDEKAEKFAALREEPTPESEGPRVSMDRPTHGKPRRPGSGR